MASEPSYAEAIRLWKERREEDRKRIVEINLAASRSLLRAAEVSKALLAGRPNAIRSEEFSPDRCSSSSGRSTSSGSCGYANRNVGSKASTSATPRSLSPKDVVVDLASFAEEVGLTEVEEARLLDFCKERGLRRVEDIAAAGLAEDLLSRLQLRTVPRHKAATFFRQLKLTGAENIAPTHLLANRGIHMPHCERVGYHSPAQLDAYIDAVHSRMGKHTLPAFHFTSKKNLDAILSITSPGLRATEVGPMGIGLSMCAARPTQLQWSPWCGGSFREFVGKALWGERWRRVLLGGEDADKLEVMLILEVPSLFSEEGSFRVAGRSHVAVIPHTRRILLEIGDGHYYFPRERITSVAFLNQ